ncbi:hypothetical protein ACFL6R_03440 [Gemmatimonadota bacterium]
MTPTVSITTDTGELDTLLTTIRSFLEADIMELVVDGRKVSGFRTPDASSLWIRDHCDMLRIGRYFHPDATSVVEHFAETQSATGRIFDYFTTFPEKLPCERENWTKYVRVPVEADVEYRFVKAAWLAWQACGDDEWLRRMLPAMDRALEYILNNPWYFDEGMGLIKRAYTIDTWDFAYTAGEHEWLQFQIDDNTFWGIMHGDNSGYLEAFRIMARVYRHLGHDPGSDEGVERAGEWRDRAALWDERADRLRERMNEVCWNGDFYTHFVKLSEVEIPGVDEAAQLSLSNPMDINRGAATHEMAVAIIEEYRRRRETTGAFAEWFSVDPPFPDGIFGDEKLVGGAYVNGGIMPLVGGELARAALEHGYEAYGVDILRQYLGMISGSGETYLWYFPDGTPASVETSTSPEASATDGWGSSAMLYALIEGVAGVEDEHRSFERIRLSPRWEAAGVARAEVELEYAGSGSGFGYTYEKSDGEIGLELTGRASPVTCHVLLPGESGVTSVRQGDEELEFTGVTVEASRYVDFIISDPGAGAVTIAYSAV